MSGKGIEVVFPKEDSEPVVVRFHEGEVNTEVTFATGLKGPDPGVPSERRKTALRMAIVAAEAFRAVALKETGDPEEPPPEGS